MPKFYEVHVHIPEVSDALAITLIAELKALGMQSRKYFIKVTNEEGISPENHPCPLDPGDHDIEDPMISTSTYFNDFEKAVAFTNKAMAILLKHRVGNGNFEFEEILPEDGDWQPEQEATIADFPGYKESEGAPDYEVHVPFESSSAEDLPSIDQIIGFIERILGYRPNQIVDFFRPEIEGGLGVYKRIATIFTTSAEAATGVRSQIEASLEMQPYRRKVVAERVWVVGY